MAPSGLHRPSADDPVKHTNASLALVDAASLAEMLGVDRSWVYTHANELGALTLGTGPKPRLRFNPETALEQIGCWSSSRSQATNAQSASGTSAPEPVRSSRRSPNGTPKRSSAGSILAIRPRKAA